MSTFEPAEAYVRQNAGRAVENLRRFVEIDTSFPGQPDYAAFADAVEPVLYELGLKTRRHLVPEALWRSRDVRVASERVNVVAAGCSAQEDLGLYFHVDTVPPAEGWQSDPFVLEQHDDRLVGLGAADTKGPMAAALLALEAARVCGLRMRYNPVLLFCTDEEGGLYPGVRYLAEQGQVPPLTINFNGTPEARIWAGCFGLFNLRIRLFGHTTHAGAAGAARNAVEGGVRVQAALLELAANVRARESAMPAPPYAKGEPLRPSLSIMAVSGGTGSGGQIPSIMDIAVSRRYAPEERFDDIFAEIEIAVRESVPAGLLCQIDMTGHLCPTSDPYGPHWPRWQAAVARGFGHAPDTFRRWGSSSCSDFGWVQKATQRSEVLLGGLIRPESRVHSPGEFTTVPDLVSLSITILSFLSEECDEASFVADKGER
ncbi:MAG: M20/M25/M40 family metallo-hydrolase [Gluconacetobacter liquefaciens]